MVIMNASTLLCSLLGSLIFCTSSAAVIDVDLTGNGGQFDFQVQNDSVAIFYGELDVDIGAYVNGIAQGTVNAATYFGVNAPDLLPGSDDTDQLDGVEGQEELRFSFSILSNTFLRKSDFVGFTLGSFTTGDTGEYSVDGGSVWIPFDGGVDPNAFTVAVPDSLDGYDFRIRHTGGNGFSVSSLQLDIVVLPEPSALGFTLMGLVCLRRRWLTRYFQRRQ